MRMLPLKAMMLFDINCSQGDKYSWKSLQPCEYNEHDCSQRGIQGLFANGTYPSNGILELQMGVFVKLSMYVRM